MTAAAPRKLPGSLETNRRLDRWLTFNADGTVTVRPGKVEIGQGILTALVQIVAEELDVRASRIRLVPAATTLSPDEGVTSGSRSIQESGIALRFAAAEARELLYSRAAEKLGASVEQLSVDDGVISSRAGGSVSYWELADESLLDRESSGDAQPKTAAEYTLVGRPLQRIDIPAKVVGMPVYVHDLERPGMLHARRRPRPRPRHAARDRRLPGGPVARRRCRRRAQRQLSRGRSRARGAGHPRFAPPCSHRELGRRR